MITTLGAFLIIINTFLIWVNYTLLEDFEIENIKITFIAALLITITDPIVKTIF